MTLSNFKCSTLERERERERERAFKGWQGYLSILMDQFTDYTKYTKHLF